MFSKSTVKANLNEKISMTYADKQNLLVEQNVLELLILISECIELKIYKSMIYLKFDKEADEKKELTYEDLKFRMDKDDKYDQIPQNIAKRMLTKPLISIFKIFFLAVSDSTVCSRFLSRFYKFFLNLSVFYPEPCCLLLQEIAKNITELVGLSNGKNFYEAWISGLEEINESIGNIKQQIFYINMLSALIISDNNEGAAVTQYQNKIFKGIFFKKQDQNLQQSEYSEILPDGFLRFSHNEDRDVFVHFATKEEHQFLERNPSIQVDKLGNS